MSERWWKDRLWVVPGVGAPTVSSLPDVLSETSRDFCKRIKKCAVQTSVISLGLAHLAAQTKAGHKDTATFRLR